MKSRFRHETNSPLLAALILSALLSNTAPLRAINPPAFAFSIDSSAVPGGFNNPQHLAVDTAGNLYVTDTGSNRVLRLSSSGAYLAQWGSPGTNAGQFSSPLGIAIDANNNVWVADKGNARVQKFSTNGNYSGSVALTLFGSPPVSGVAVDSANNLYAAYGNGSSTGLVVRFTSAGVSNAAYSANTIIYPEDVALDAANNVYVAGIPKPSTNSICKFANSGSLSASWGAAGTNAGQFSNNVTSLAIDKNNNLFVADAGNSRIQELDLSGVPLTQWGTQGSAQGQFSGQIGIAVDRSGSIVYVADAGNNRIQVFDQSLAQAFSDDFESYSSPITITTACDSNGYRFLAGQASGPQDFTAILGFDYSTVNWPLTIPSAPRSSGGTTKGLYLTANKNDATAAAAAVNVYPLGQFFSGNFSFKFDLWINWTNTASSTEHVLFGINHSGNITNRVGQVSSDGLFFAMDGDGGVPATVTTVRDFSVFRGTSGVPFLMLTNNTTFGPAPPLGPQFDNTNSGFATLFPAKSIPGYPNGMTPVGSAGLGWVTGEVRQQNKLITWLLNGTIIAQYTNNFAYTNGTIMLGYNDVFGNIGDANNFAIFDNISVQPLSVPVQILSPKLTNGNFSFSFVALSGQSYTIQNKADLTGTNWADYTNFLGSGSITQIALPVTASNQFFRVRQP